MKKSLIPLLFCLFSALWAQEVATISVAWETELKPPFLMADDAGNPYGIMVEIVSVIFQRKGIEVRHIFLPWQRCLAALQEGDVDVVPNASYTEERARFACYSDVVYKTHLRLFYLKSRYPQPPVIRTPDDLLNYSVGGVLGFNYSWYEGVLDLDRGAKTRTALLNKVRYGRLDMALLQQEVLTDMSNKGLLDLSPFASVPDPVHPEKEYHIVFGKNRKGLFLKEIVDNELELIRAEGIIRSIYKKYLGEGPVE